LDYRGKEKEENHYDFGGPRKQTKPPLFSSQNKNEKQKKITMFNTSKGVLYVLVGIAIFFLPYISFMGTVLLLYGIIYIYNGKNEFNEEHKNNVNTGIVIFSFGFTLVIISIFLYMRSLIISDLNDISRTLFYLNYSIYLSIFGLTLFFISLYFFVKHFSKSYVKALLVITIICYVSLNLFINLEPIDYNEEKELEENDQISQLGRNMDFRMAIQNEYYDRYIQQMPINFICIGVFVIGYVVAYQEVKKFHVFLDKDKIYLAKSRKKEEYVIEREFNFYCKNCFFQTNDKLEICPKCKKDKLVKVRS
jgi:uncharacterized membrane protein HdeD (DUF308 family)